MRTKAKKPRRYGWFFYPPGTPQGFGPLFLTFTAAGLASLDFHHEPASLADDPDPDLLPQPIMTYIEVSKKELSTYFAAIPTDFRSLTLDLQGTPFQLRVWQELKKIPWGATISYQELARRLGHPKAARAVGQAVGANPVAIIIPCHRVIAAHGSLGGYGGGLPRKRWLLEHEGVQLWGEGQGPEVPALPPHPPPTRISLLGEAGPEATPPPAQT